MSLQLLEQKIALPHLHTTSWATASLPVQRGGLPPGALRRVREHIERQIANSLDVSELAAIAALSDSHFSRAFKQSMGISPHRYVLDRRIELAATLLRDSTLLLADIALYVGFADQSHFTRRFVAIMRETPSRYRHRHR
jgi:transcriptional regulator GlxA family with amidase domain